MTLRLNSPDNAQTRAALEQLLKAVPTSAFEHLRNPKTVSGWKYVYPNGRAFIGRVAGKYHTNAWRDATLCAAELFLLENPNSPVGKIYARLVAGDAPDQIAELRAALGAQGPAAQRQTEPPPERVPAWDADPAVGIIENKIVAVVKAINAMERAGDEDGLEKLKEVLARLTVEFNQATRRADRRAEELAQAKAKATLDTMLAEDPDLRAALAEVRANPSSVSSRMIHDFATEKARAAFAATLQGDHSYVPTHINLRPSVDYAVVQGVMSYWYHWIGAKMGSIQDPVFDNIGLDNPLAAPEIRRLLAQGIPADFLYHPQTKQLLHDMSDPAGPPATGFPCTIGAAAMLVHLRPATHLVPWQPLPDDAACDVGMLADFVMGYDPKQTAMTGRAQPLKLPSYLRGADAQRFPVLTVPEAFLTWTLAIAAASGVGSGYAKVVLSAQTAVDRVAAYTNLRVSRAFGQTSTVENWKNISQLWTSRRALGEPESEIRADLGDPPVRPDLDPDWNTPVLRLKAAVIEQLPMFAHWASMPALLHGAGQRFEPLDVLGELDRAKTPPALPPAPEPKPARAPVLMPWITPAPWDDETA